MDVPHQHVRLLSDLSSDKAPSVEVVAAELVGPDTYRLIDSPIAVLGCARDDIIRVNEKGIFQIIQQGGRISVQVFTHDDPEAVREKVVSGIAAWDGSLDNVVRLGTVFAVSIPLAVGHKAIAAFFEHVVAEFTRTDWQYGSAFPQSGGDTYLPWTREFFSR